ncbi:cupredoxin domain-containing protein [Shewanella sp. SR43-4]|jgi:plastocyanin domain-containing protein|uniref:Cupredoxin domain-containing protein n=3 Tax=Gammaproteobacteria TaxID=1236 RepID=A0AAE4Q3B6_9GAMM|nr:MULTISPECIES: cupredoxin domain-containing protein [Shewanella]MBB1318628.1 cupredoxin domain-containing protein [Shewanella sp. SR43-4]MBB1323802.1 cupredoxin domain-containing protein [Shewanella sp. SR43-8]MBB1364084.1 cupredoxin domain-containing protein [Shewanella sp. SR44-4]MBB1390198.1 cupredoxin domain-containing protein [Shewanella sp. SG44-6]MCL1091993.1 cupredoxin domain-containing protein [Shewanella profunda]|tara:strand:+ start:9834 stop:10184 length:351 start_codon:yes stop_codon:yes gene_type:complete
MLINLLCIALIGFIIWWFWLYKPTKDSSVDASTLILVKDGVYTPARIKISANTPTEITFLRQDKSGCSATVLLPDLEISQDLALDKPTTISLPALEKGEYPFHCQMQMYKGVLIVE